MERNFKLWFLSHGGKFHPDVDVVSNADGFYLCASNQRDLATRTCVVSCPHTLTISWFNAVLDLSLGDFDLHRINQSVLTRFFLVKQYLLQEKSSWWRYIQILPQPEDLRRLNTPLWYESGDFVWIHGTNLELSAQKLEASWHKEYEEAMNMFELGKSENIELWSWPLYKWAAAIIASRGFPASVLRNLPSLQSWNKSLPAFTEAVQRLEPGTELDSPVLIPGMDLLNHRPQAKVTWLWGHSHCSLVVNESTKRGTQIWNNYGPKSNGELILGYGFSLFRNSADFCSLPISAEKQKQTAINKDFQLESHKSATVNADKGLYREDKTIDELIPGKELTNLEALMSQGIGQRPVCGEANLSVSGQLVQSANSNFHWVSLKAIAQGNGSDRDQTLYKFSPGFLRGISISFANKRETAESNFNLESCVDFLNTRLSRNKLHVMCAVMMILQRQRSAIRKYDPDLPPWPQNERQFHAARYRRNQLQILNAVIQSLLGSLRDIAGLSPLASKAKGSVRLESILTETPRGFLTDFRAALNAGLGTRNAAKIRKNGWVECAFTIWLYGLFLWQSSAQTDGASYGPSFSSEISLWLIFLRRFYGTPFRTKPKVGPVHYDSDRLGISGESGGENRLICTSFMAVIRAAINKNPYSIYGSSEVTVDDLEWCLNIIREEGIMCPNLEGEMGEETDEFILFLEDDGSEAI